MVMVCLNYIQNYIIYTSKEHSELTRIYDGVEAETMQSQASFQIV